MKRRLQQVTENGQKVWRITGAGIAALQSVDFPCEKMRKAKEKALKVTAEIEAEKNKTDAVKAEGETG